MSLATPSSLAVSRMFRVLGPTQTAADGTQWGPKTFQVFGRITWTNAEAGTHAVELTVGGRVTWLPKGAELAQEVLLGTWTAPDVADKSVAISVKLKSASEESTAATLTATVAGAGSATLSGPLTASGANFVLPAWSGVMNRFSGQPDGSILVYWTALAANVPFAHTDLTVGIPKTLRPSQTHRVVLRMTSGAVISKTYSYFRTVGGGDFTSRLPASVDGYLFTDGSPTTIDPVTFFDTPATAGTFTATSKVVRLIKDEVARIPLESSHPATWAIDSGAPAGFAVVAVAAAGDLTGLEIPPSTEYLLMGTPTATGTASVVLTATRTADSTTATATIDLTITTSGGVIDRTVVIANPGWLNNGLAYVLGETVSIAMVSSPSPARWSATGLPPGLSINAETGQVSGRLSMEGRFITSFVATAPGKAESLPVMITFTVRAAGTGSTPPAVTPATRIPWILQKWNLIDLQILARTRAVQSTLMGANGIRIKIGDALAFALFFIGADDRPFDLVPTKLRITLRPADNLEAALIFETATSPSLVTTEPDPYYLLTAVTGPRQREVVQKWVEMQGENKGLALVAEVEWTHDSKTYSSDSFAATAELDVARP
jgi:hypothetical protein